MIPDNITTLHVDTAISDILMHGVPPLRKSKKFHLIYYDSRGEHHKLPPKYVISVSNRFANGVELDDEEFYAGWGQGNANAFLEDLGYVIQPSRKT